MQLRGDRYGCSGETVARVVIAQNLEYRSLLHLELYPAIDPHVPCDSDQADNADDYDIHKLACVCWLRLVGW